jgi:hypothetical protein
MVAIKDMEMPKDCMECMFCNHIKSNDYGTYGDCAILGDKERMNLLLHQKHSDCPLIDIEERKVGKWIGEEEGYYSECSCCGASFLWEDYKCIGDWKYCPKCGAEITKE